MAEERAFLKYIGNRKWRKLRKANIPPGKFFLVYLGNRKWKKRKVQVSSLFKMFSSSTSTRYFITSFNKIGF
jgi:hypothetical protein